MTASAGQFLRQYQPDALNANRFINDAFGRSSVRAFHPSAIITNDKELPDASFYQGEIDWDTMRLRTDAVIIRIGQNLWPDTQFSRNWTQAKQRGMLRGGYWFYDDRIDPGRQADKCASMIAGDMPEMEVYADWENTYGGAFGGLKNVVAFMQRLELLTGCKTGFYTGYYWFRDNSNAITNSAQYTWLKSRPLWLGWYTSNPANVLVPAPWATLALWQYGTPSMGSLYGVKTIEIDMNVFNGTTAEFYARYQTETPPTNDGETMSQWYKVNTAVLNIRTGPGTSYQDVGDLLQGDVVETVRNVGGWLETVKIIRAANGSIETPIPSVYCKDSYCVAIAPPVTPPPPVGPTLTHTIQVYSDGSVKVDGNPIP